MRTFNSLVDIRVPPGYRIVICGDTHGYYNAVTRVFRKAGFPHKHKRTIYVGESMLSENKNLTVGS